VGSWERERRHQGPDQEEEPLLRRGPSPGKRSLTHRFIASDQDESAGDAPADIGMAPASHVRAQVEATTGGDLSAARVHTGAESQAEASALRARAFTVGSDIHFAAGQYQPGTPAGDALIAHELVHTLQQGGGEPTAQLKASDVSQESDAAEVEADRIAHAAVSGASTRMAPVQRAAGIARTPESLSGNPAERGPAATPTTSHRSVGVGDAVNAPATGTPGTSARTTNVKPKATEAAPFHVAGSVCPLDSVLYEEDTSGASPAPSGFTTVTGFQGTTAAPMVTQEATNGIYIAGAPALEDVQQAGIGDCAFLALVGSIVTSDPGKIPSIMAADGRGGATVTLWRRQAHTPTILERVFGGAPANDWIQVAVTVNDQLAVNVANNRVHGAQLRCAPNPIAQDWWSKVVAPNLEIHRKDTFEVARWAPLLEKAYARFAQNHGNYGGARPGGKTAASGYDAIHGGWSHDEMCVFYGPLADDPAHSPIYQNTAWTPGGNVVSANAAIMDRLILLQGGASAAAPGTAPIIQATSSSEPLIARLTLAIPAAVADPDYANVDLPRQGLVTAVLTTLTTYNGLPADPPAPAAQPKATARAAIAPACVTAIRPGLADSAAQQENLNTYFRGFAAPVQFSQGDAAVPPDRVTGLRSMGSNLRVLTTPPVAIQLDGHSSSEGTDVDNMTLSQQRVDNVETAINAGGPFPAHTMAKAARGEVGATTDPSWRRVDITITATNQPSNSLLDAARSRPIREMAALMVDLRNIGTDSSTGQRNVYAEHVYSVLAVNIVTTTGVVVPLGAVPAANRAALYPLVDPNVSTVTLRNPHHGNEPDRRDNRGPDRPGDGPASGANSDGVFNMSLNDFFLHFTSLQSGVMPRT
jgi:outer membrane protein OmpA-like peptidoglycan-associated protein